MMLRYNLGGGKFVECKTDDRGLAEKYANLNMDRFLVITDENGHFKMAINPKLIVSIEAI